MSAPAVVLRQIVSAEDPVDCLRCHRGFELRFWRVISVQMLCPCCGGFRLISDVIQEARDGGNR